MASAMGWLRDGAEPDRDGFEAIESGHRRCVTDETARHREIDWDSAEVRERTLTVNLTGEPSKIWKAGMESVVARLDQPGNQWGRVRATKRRVEVKHVAEGEEDRLRHFLEAAVLQANANLASATVESTTEPEAGPGAMDLRMTDAFRALGGGAESSS
jgi:hypothetical protein